MGAGPGDPGTQAAPTSRWTRSRTGHGLPDEVVADMRRLYDFECRHPRETWNAPSEALLRDARELCSLLFPSYSEDALHLEVQSLLFSVSRRPFRIGPSASAVRADGARAQVGM